MATSATGRKSCAATSCCRVVVVVLAALVPGGSGGAGGSGGFRDSSPDEGDMSESYRPQSGAPQGGDFPETDDDDIPF